MTTTNTNPNYLNNSNSTTELAALQAEVELDSTDLVAKISLASALEQAGEVSQAVALYQEVVSLDPAGTCGSVAHKALEALQQSSSSLETSQPAPESQRLKYRGSFHPQSSLEKPAKVLIATQITPGRKSSYLQWFYNLPISRKQILALFLSEVVSVVGLGIGARVILETGLRTQLQNQAKSEVAVTDTNYNIKINQMGFGFRGQADNTAIIAAARANSANQPLDPALQQQVKAILQNEIKARKIEYATLVGKDLRIIVNGNADRTGEIFDPKSLVSRVLANPQQIKVSEVISRAEIIKESPLLPPGFKSNEALIRYTVTPVTDPDTKQVIGALVSGDIVNGKLPIVESTLSAFGGGYSAIYLREPQGKLVLATALNQDQGSPQANIPLPANSSLLSTVIQAPNRTVTERLQVAGSTYTVAAKSIVDSAGKPIAVMVRGTPETAINQILAQSLQQVLIVFCLALLVIVFWAVVLSRSIVRPIESLRKTTQKFSEGDRQAQAEVFATDEVGQLAATFNQMANSINASETALEAQSQQRQAEADYQRQERERLQQGVIDLLLDIEEAQRGDLTIRAKVDESEMGSIADAFNATIRSLSEIVTQVKTATDQVRQSSSHTETSMEKLSQEATIQAQAVTAALTSVADMGQSIQSVATSAQEAAAIARQALLAAHTGGETMDQTVGSIQNIRTSVAETAKKMKRLAESSQEISKIISIISGISEKTNLLAFNASIEASRAGENGQGFRVVADEVRRLAERVTDSTKEIEQLVSTIQQETAEVLQTMEASTTQVVTGTELVGKTKQTLQGLAEISQKIDQLLQSISASTVSQAEVSGMVNQTMQEVAAIAQSTSSESAAVSSSLQQLVTVSQELQNSVSRFRVEK